MYVYISISIYVYTYMYTYTYGYVHIYIYIYIYTYDCCYYHWDCYTHCYYMQHILYYMTPCRPNRPAGQRTGRWLLIGEHGVCCQANE